MQALAVVLLLAFLPDTQEPRQLPVGPPASSAAGSLKPSSDATSLSPSDPRAAIDALLGSSRCYGLRGLRGVEIHPARVIWSHRSRSHGDPREKR